MVGPIRAAPPNLAAEQSAALPSPHGYWRESWQRLTQNRAAVISIGVLGFVALFALTAPLLAGIIHRDPTRTDLADIFAGPSASHLLGSDDLGHDTLARLAYGARVSLGIGLLTVVIQLTIGATVGILAGFYGGWLDALLMRVVDVVLSFPDIFLFMLIAVLIRPTPLVLVFVIASVGWADVSRLVRGEVISLRERDFVLAVRSLGVGDSRIMLRHILPNALPILIVTASLRVGQIILIEAALDFLGLGVQPPEPSWGNMLSNSENYFFHSIWLVVLPGLCIFATVLATNILGNALRDSLDPRLRST